MWKTFGASCQGGAHIRLNLSCQDASLCRDGPGYSIAAAADGHGSPRHFRSETGAALACSTACECLEAFFLMTAQDILPSEDAVTQLKERILSAWQRAVQKDLSLHSWTPEELAAQAGILSPDEYDKLTSGKTVWSPYGSTLVALLVTERFWLALQLGDGDMLTISPTGDFSWPMPESQVNIGRYTASLCMTDPMPEFRHCMGNVFPAAFLAYTDGVEKAFPARGKQMLEFLYAIWNVVLTGKPNEVHRALTAVTQLGPVKDDATIVGVFNEAVKIRRPDFSKLQQQERLARLQALIDDRYAAMEYNLSRLRQTSSSSVDDEYAALEMEQIILLCAQEIDDYEQERNELMGECREPEPDESTPGPNGNIFDFDDEAPSFTWASCPTEKDSESCDIDNP